MTTRKYALLFSLLTLLLIPTLAFAEAGKIMFALGGSTIEKVDGTRVKAKRGLVIDAGDKIRTSPSGQVQVKMSDGGLIAVRPNSVFIIDAFANTGDIKTDKSFFSLMKGGFRSVTGSVGEKNKSAYKVKTPVATIGIRGTDYTARLCAGDCGTDSVNDGLYVGVFSGGVSLTNDVGIIDVDPTEYGYVADPFSVPQNIDSAPGNLLFAQSTTDQPENTDQQTTASTSTEVAAVEQDSAVALPTIDTNGNDQSEPATIVSEDTVPPTLRRVLNAMTGSTLSGVNKASVTDSDGAVSLADTGEITAFSANYIDPISGSVTNVSYTADANTQLVEYVSDSATGIHWGRWNGGSMNVTDSSGTVTSSALSDANSMHWIALTDEATIELPTTGTGNYIDFAGTSPTDSAGNVGILDGSTIVAYFNTKTLDLDLNAIITGPDSVNDIYWNANKADVAIQNDGSFSTDLAATDVTASYFGTDYQGSGHVTGSFTSTTVSSQPAGALSAYHLESSVEGNAVEVNGTVAYKNTLLP